VNLKEAIKWAERDITSLFGKGGGSKLAYYVCRWNDEYIVHSNTFMDRHPEVEWVYNTIDKKIIMEEHTLSSDTEEKDFRVGHIIKYNRWTEGDEVPKIFKCIKYDEDWGVVWYNDRGRKDSIGISSVRRANFIEKFKWLVFYSWM